MDGGRGMGRGTGRGMGMSGPGSSKKVGGGPQSRGQELEDLKHQADSFLINKTTGIDVEEIESLSDDIAIISIAKIESVINYIEQELDWIKHDIKNQRFVSAG